MKYICIKTTGVIGRIAIETDIPGYTEGILEPFFPSEEELETWNKIKQKEWIKQNNKRMRAICKFLNENDL